jgi:ribonuclease HI
MTKLMNKTLDSYTDGSCVHQSEPARRMAGVGVWFADGHEHNVSEPLPGDKQTSARAELVAIVRALEQAELIDGSLPLVVRSDSSYAVLEMQRILYPDKHRAIRGERPNGDVLARLKAAVRARHAPVRIEKVDGHSDDPGNDGADLLARRAAQYAYEQRHSKQT